MFSTVFDYEGSFDSIKKMLGRPCDSRENANIPFFSYSDGQYLLSCLSRIVEKEVRLYVNNHPKYTMTKCIEDEWIILDEDIDVVKALNGRQIDIANATCYKDFVPVVRELFEKLKADDEAVIQTHTF